jgi:L-alanine-DL-glutamate epimerase-like enolase superfamily enzyme
MVAAVRNVGRPGVAATAISAVDVALWDLKARLAGQPLFRLLGPQRESVPIYGSGGFTTYTDHELTDQLGGWVQQGIPRVKMKIGTDWGSRPELDVHRVKVARAAIGPEAELFVDANGAYSVKQALALAERFAAESQVSWFEEPVSSDDLDGLRLVRERAPVMMDIAAGEYGFDVGYFERMIAAGAVDVLQADITRCAGITELLRVGALCRARNLPLSLHCSPAAHLHAALALEPLRHLEYFHDHVRIEHLLFDGVVRPRQGALFPDLDRPGTGLEFRAADAERYAA